MLIILYIKNELDIKICLGNVGVSLYHLSKSSKGIFD